MLSFRLLFFVIEVFESSLKFLSFFYNHECLVSMFFELEFRSLRLVVSSFRLVIYNLF